MDVLAALSVKDVTDTADTVLEVGGSMGAEDIDHTAVVEGTADTDEVDEGVAVEKHPDTVVAEEHTVHNLAAVVALTAVHGWVAEVGSEEH